MEKFDKILFNLRLERNDLSNKISALTKFRETEEWRKLSTAHKSLLDVQLEIMKSYAEVLTARLVDIKDNMTMEEAIKDHNSEDDDSHQVKIIILGLGDSNE